MIFRHNRLKHGSEKGSINYTVMTPSETGLDVPVRHKIAYTIRAGAPPSFDDPGYDDEVDVTLTSGIVLSDDDMDSLIAFIKSDHQWGLDYD